MKAQSEALDFQQPVGGEQAQSRVARKLWLRLRSQLSLAFRFDSLRESIAAGSRFAQAKMPLFAILSLGGHPIYYLIWTRVFPQPYETIWLRLAAMITAMPFIFLASWNKQSRQLLPLYSFAALTINLPLFFTYLMLMNQFSVISVMSQITSLFLILMIYDLRTSIVSFMLGGVIAGALAWSAGMPEIPWHMVDEMLPVWGFILITGALFNISRMVEYQTRTQTLLATASTIAHELRTPLSTIRLAALGNSRHLADLVSSYRTACESGLKVPLIHPGALKVVEQTTATLQAEVDHAMVTIDMLLASTNPRHKYQAQRLSAKKMIDDAVRRYPFGSTEERGRVRSAAFDGADFLFEGSPTLLVNVLFNLIKNAVFHTARAQKGDVTLSLRRANEYGEIIVHDTGPGISPAYMPRIFNRFITTSDDPTVGLGIGLAFCRETVDAMGGEIRCDSVCGEFATFVLRFPIVAV